ncbi:MAG: TIGR00730 family Rossman fold protein [Moraxella sp.]|nr:TIGR00730 family Rossman fold protein [Moraxella sp.]
MVAVYCGSRIGNSPIYQQVASELGEALVKAGLGLVYGAGSIGIMGVVSDSVLTNGGKAIGVIPEFLGKKEIPNSHLTQLYITDTMHTRKAMMAMFADAFVTLSGGLGTLEELMEVATWRQLYQHQKPIIILNTDGFYDALIAHLDNTVTEGFMSQGDLDRIIVCDTVSEVIGALKPIVRMDEDVAVERF